MEPGARSLGSPGGASTVLQPSPAAQVRARLAEGGSEGWGRRFGAGGRRARASELAHCWSRGSSSPEPSGAPAAGAAAGAGPGVPGVPGPRAPPSLPPSPGRAAGGRALGGGAGGARAPQPPARPEGGGEGKEGGGRGRDCGPEETSRGAARSPGGAGGQRRGRLGPLPLALPSRSSLSRAVSICAPPRSLRARSLARSFSPSLASLCLWLSAWLPWVCFPLLPPLAGRPWLRFSRAWGLSPFSVSRSRGVGGGGGGVSPKIAALKAAPKPLQAPVPGREGESPAGRGGGGRGGEP